MSNGPLNIITTSDFKAAMLSVDHVDSFKRLFKFKNNVFRIKYYYCHSATVLSNSAEICMSNCRRNVDINTEIKT